MGSKASVISLVLLVCSFAIANQEHPADKPKYTRDGAKNPRTTASKVVVQAKGLLGVRYQAGGKTPGSGFDCSGFVSHVFKEAAGVVLPPSAYQQSMVGITVPPRQLQPGDLVFYNTLRRAFSHVGIYIGDDKFIHAPSRGKAVEIVDMKASYWSKRFEGARRVTQLKRAEPLPPTSPRNRRVATVLH